MIPSKIKSVIHKKTRWNIQHAAIINREMKKPCIVGIRDLTRILSEES
ncbi:MAG TPA: PEP-utilizing enzyme [Candidatus Nanoarchaeia archaeon]|nr:PEP-utilizing enzyme [Candidatus Nanoarchaeia archaeon]